MSKYKIGITEAGDAGIDLSWTGKLGDLDGAIVITKNITPGFCNAVMGNSGKLIIHATITGYGSTIIEPDVPPPQENFDALTSMIQKGFPREQVVIRVDPIIPTPKGIQTAFDVLKAAINGGFSRFRVSIIDMYPHVRVRFQESGLPRPYGDTGFSPNAAQVKAVDDMLGRVVAYWCDVHPPAKDHYLLNGCQIECCAEPGLVNAMQCGCVSFRDLELLGLDPEEDDHAGYKRRNCMCYSGKHELLEHKTRCPHGCLYCYWK